MSVIDWAQMAEAAEEGTKPLADGTYRIKVDKAEAVTASTGSPMVNMIVAVEDERVTGTRRIWTNAVLKTDSPWATKRWFSTLAAFGLTVEWLAETDATLDMIAMALVGRYAMAEVITETFRDEPRNKVKNFLLDTEAMQPSLPSGSDLAMASAGGAAVAEDEIQF